MERTRHATTPRIAFLIALIDIILIAFTVHKELPNVRLELQTPFPQLLDQAGVWFNLAEMLFHSAGLIMVYGAISLLMPRLRFVMWLGAGLANLAGIPYLISLVVSYRSNQPSGTIQIALFMFLVCMLLPFLVSRLFGFLKGSS